MRLSDLSTAFIQAMAQAMYRYEAAQINCPELLTDAEILDFYCTYLGR